MAPALITKAARSKSGLQIIVVSFDGFLYVIDGRSACYDLVDIGKFLSIFYSQGLRATLSS